jgi:hypothetical protein
MNKTTFLGLALALVVAGPAAADVWDIQGDNDDSNGTDNELLHGTIQTHDMAVRPGPVADQDWYLMPQKRNASYEILVDGTSGMLGFNGFAVERIASDGATVVQAQEAAVTGSDGYSRALRWANTTTTTANEFIRISGQFCGTSCGPEDTYTIRVKETTVNVPRFNNGGAQVTVLLSQNASERPINATYFYWSNSGTLLQTGTLTNFPSKNLNVFVTTLFPALQGQGGHITVAHDGGYGGLVVKTVALEPSTGFSFDTPGVYVPD